MQIGAYVPMHLFFPQCSYLYLAYAVFWLCMFVFSFYFEISDVFCCAWSRFAVFGVVVVQMFAMFHFPQCRCLPWHRNAQALGGNENGTAWTHVCTNAIEISKSAKSANQANQQICKISKWCTHEQNQKISKLAKFNAAALPMAPLAWNWPGLRWGWGRKRSA